jgi:hypothetical protein
MQRWKVYSFCSRCKLLLAAIVWMTKASGTAGQVVVVCNGEERPDAPGRGAGAFSSTTSSSPPRVLAAAVRASFVLPLTLPWL